MVQQVAEAPGLLAPVVAQTPYSPPPSHVAIQPPLYFLMLMLGDLPVFDCMNLSSLQVLFPSQDAETARLVNLADNNLPLSHSLLEK